MTGDVSAGEGGSHGASRPHSDPALAHGWPIPPSCLHEVFNLVEAREAATGRRCVRLHVGEPQFGPPAEVVEALVRAVREGRTQYGSVQGLLELRTALVAKLQARNGIRTSEDNVFVCPGSTQGLAAVMRSLAGPGAGILIPSIHWPIYLQQSIMSGLEPVFYPLDAGYRVDVDAVARAATPGVRVLLVNSPANPTGAILDARTRAALLELARSRGWMVISDEAYEDFVYDGDHGSMAALEQDCPEASRRVFSVFTFSKSHAMTGYRLGYIVTPNGEAAAALRAVQEASIVAPSTPVQVAGLGALGLDEGLRERCRQMRATRDRLLGPLVEDGLLEELPRGGWYALLNVARAGVEASRFAAALLDRHDVAVAPAAGFALRPVRSAADGRPTFAPDPAASHLVRIAFCGDPADLERGIAHLRAMIAEDGSGIHGVQPR